MRVWSGGEADGKEDIKLHMKSRDEKHEKQKSMKSRDEKEDIKLHMKSRERGVRSEEWRGEG